MKRILYYILTSILLSISFNASSYSQSHRRNIKKKPSIDWSREKDSVTWLRDRYCDMLFYDQNRASMVLSHLQHKFATFPKPLQDTLLAVHYQSMVTLFEQERNDRAYAFADCYYALCDRDDPNLGTLYLNDIVLAIENMDTVKLRSRMNQLSEYATRNKLDYDSDLADAEVNMNMLRHRIKFQETPIHMLKGQEMWICDISASFEGELTSILEEWLLYIPQFIDIRNGEIERYNYYPWPKKRKGDMYIDPSTPPCYGHKFDEESKTFYCIWGHEQTRSADPQLLGAGRQLTQDIHVTVAGELAKKKYSYGTRMAGNVAVSLVDIGLNALFDYLSITTEHYYRCEISLTMTQPDLMEGTLAIASTTVSSDHPDCPDTKTRTFPVRYYRMYPEYGYCYMNSPKIVFAAKTSVEQYDKLASVFKEEVKTRKPSWKKAVKEWKKEHKGEKYPFRRFEDQYNADMLSNLREKAENSLLNHPLTQP